jgi:hypothetical protein
MPRSWRYSMTELPGTLQRSCREAQETFLSALDDAIRTHGAGDQAHRTAYMVLKQKFEKRGDHWIAKDNPADCGEAGKLVSLLPAGRAAASRLSGRKAPGVPAAAPGDRARCRRDPAGHEAARRLSDTFRRPVSRRTGGVERSWQPSMTTGGDGRRRESRRKRPSAT